MKTFKELKEFAKKRFDDLDNSADTNAYWRGYTDALHAVERNVLVPENAKEES